MSTNILNIIKNLQKFFWIQKGLIAGYFAFTEEVIEKNPIRPRRILHFFYWRIL